MNLMRARTFVPFGVLALAAWAALTYASAHRLTGGGLQAVPPTEGQNALPQVTEVRAVHRHGQTFVTWREIEPAPPDDLTIAGLRALRERTEGRQIRYRIYRSDRRIDHLAGAQLVGEVAPLSAWNSEYFGIYPRGDDRPPRYVIEDGAGPLPSGTGLFVRHVPTEGLAYYAVVIAEEGRENGQLSAANALSAPVAEAIGPGIPVLQRIDHPASFNYIEGATLRFYVRWESETNSNVAGRPFDYLVAIPRNLRRPAPVGIHLHEWGASMASGWGWWYDAGKGSILLSSTQKPYDWWTGYHEHLGKRPLQSPADWQAGVVRPYTQRRMLSFVDWLATTMELDPTRTFTAGSSMGGSGSIMLAIRHPDRFAWAMSWVGVHVPAQTGHFKSSYEGVYGKPEWGVKFEDGTPVWDYFNDVWYLRIHPGTDMGLIVFSNGKNDGPIGWRQAVEFFRALQETRQPHVFYWGQEGHGQRAYMPGGASQRDMTIDLRTDQSLPAFTNGSLDDNHGDGTPASGDPAGQANAFLLWKPETIIDETDRWSVTVLLSERAPESSCTVDVTPRRLQLLKLGPGDRVEWTNRAGRRELQRGEGVADRWGLVTLPQVRVSQDGSTITVVRR